MVSDLRVSSSSWGYSHSWRLLDPSINGWYKSGYPHLLQKNIGNSYWISRGLSFLDFLGYIGFQSQIASFWTTCAQKSCEKKCWMSWFFWVQWWDCPSRETETVGNSRKQSGAALIQQKSRHSTLFLATFLRAGCSKWCNLTLKPNIP